MKKPKRTVVSIMDASAEHESTSKDQVNGAKPQNTKDLPQARKSSTDAAATLLQCPSSIEQREEELSSVLDTLEEATHQIMVNEGALCDNFSVAQIQKPPTSSSFSSIADSDLSTETSSSPSLSKLDRPTSVADVETLKTAPPKEPAEHFDTTALASLLSSEETSSGGAIEHHHQFYPSPVMSAISNGDLGYYSPSYNVSSQSHRLHSSASTRRSKSPLATSQSLEEIKQGSDSDEETGELTEAEFRTRQV